MYFAQLCAPRRVAEYWFISEKKPETKRFTNMMLVALSQAVYCRYA